MVEVYFEISGKKVRPERISDAIERAMFEKVRDDLIKKVGNIRDPQTGQPPKLHVKGRDLSSLSIQVEGSPELIEKVQERLR